MVSGGVSWSEARQIRLGFAAAVLFLAAGLLGDLQMAALGVVPILLAGVAAMGRSRDVRAGLPEVAAAISSVVLAELVRLIAGDRNVPHRKSEPDREIVAK